MKKLELKLLKLTVKPAKEKYLNDVRLYVSFRGARRYIKLRQHHKAGFAYMIGTELNLMLGEIINEVNRKRRYG